MPREEDSGFLDFPDFGSPIAGDLNENEAVFDFHVHKTKKQKKVEAYQKLQRERSDALFDELPEPGQYFHIISNGWFSYYNLIPKILKHLGGTADELIFATWNINKINVDDLERLLSEKKIKKLTAVTGLYLKMRNPEVYATLYNMVQKHKQKYIVTSNHSKMILMRKGTNYIVAEGSANFTKNPRIENCIMTNNKEVYNFHKKWIDSLIPWSKTGLIEKEKK